MATADDARAPLTASDGVPKSALPVSGTADAPQRKITAWKLAMLAFVVICGGPFGIESAVQAAGPLPTLLATAGLAVFWAFPQAIMTAELSNIFDVNGGYVVWVTQGLGRFPGFLNAFNSQGSNILDLPLYPVLFASYLEGLFDDLSSVELYLFKLVALVVVVVVNIVGLDCVAFSSVGFTVFVLLPFVVQLCVVDLKPDTWGERAQDVDYSLFVGTMLWNMQGWDSLGCFAGEVHNGRRAYPLGVSMAIIMIAATYMLPIMVAVSKDEKFEDWDDGSFVDVGKLSGLWLGYWMLFSASVAVLSTFNATFATTSRALQSIANHGMLPTFLAKNHPKYKTPVAAIILEAITTAVLMMFDFGVLVVLDTLLNNFSLVLEVIVFLKLKHTQPDLPRPYSVPGGLVGAWLCSIPKFVIIGYAFWSVGLSVALAIGLGLNVIFIVAGLLWAKYTPDTITRHLAGRREEEVEAIYPDGSNGSSPTSPSAVVTMALVGGSRRPPACGSPRGSPPSQPSSPAAGPTAVEFHTFQENGFE